MAGSERLNEKRLRPTTPHFQFGLRDTLAVLFAIAFAFGIFSHNYRQLWFVAAKSGETMATNFVALHFFRIWLYIVIGAIAGVKLARGHWIRLPAIAFVTLAVSALLYNLVVSIYVPR